MEIPLHLQNLYRHWDRHLHKSPTVIQSTKIFDDTKLLEEISWFINERVSIWEKKTSGNNPPFTKDPILLHYRFCNIFRELDKQTIIFHTHLNPLRDNFPLWLLNMFYCRMVARPQTVEAVGLLSFNKQENKLLYKKLCDSPRPRYGTPYVFPVSVILKSKTPTRELFITEYLPNIMNTIAKKITTWDKKSVSEGVAEILPIFKYNLTFLWTEVLIDVAYQYPDYIDLFAKFPIGPGSLPTMKRINREKDPELTVQNLANLGITTTITVQGKPLYLSAENWEGIGCEFRKYTNLQSGRGRKRIFAKK